MRSLASGESCWSVRVCAVRFLLLVSAAVALLHEHTAKRLVKHARTRVSGENEQKETTGSGFFHRRQKRPSDATALRLKVDVKLFKPLPVHSRET